MLRLCKYFVRILGHYGAVGDSFYTISMLKNIYRIGPWSLPVFLFLDLVRMLSPVFIFLSDHNGLPYVKIPL
jgi:hypothetical protein